MCTVTFIARKSGYALAMNRDEKLTRVPGLPPSKKTINGRTVLCSFRTRRRNLDCAQ